MTEHTKLKPCPFCGGGDSEKSNFGFGYHETRDGCWVLCMSCHAEGPLVEPSDNAKAIAAWNRRSPAPAEAIGWEEAIEAAAKVADETAALEDKHDRYEAWRAAHDIAQTIRSLLPSSGRDGRKT